MIIFFEKMTDLTSIYWELVIAAGREQGLGEVSLF